ncbi:MAG: ornithine carbamoyltransferase, partial [Acidobacteriota bacterium]|nr:ornithine carbamoyltransferase [Acidobacteriota bacterium]
MTRHLLTIDTLSDDDLTELYALARAPFDDELLKGQGVALVFERPSLRTRASSATAVAELGGFATFFSDDEIGLDRRESAEDVARTLSEMYAIAALRLRRHDV